MGDEDQKKEIAVQRKSSDILLEVEAKLDTVMKMIAVYDMNAKLTLDRVNKIYSILNAEKPKIQLNNTTQQQTVSANPMNYGEFISSKLDVKEIVQTTDESDFEDRLIGNSSIPLSEKPIINKRNQSKQSSDKKYPVQQRVVNSTGQNQFMSSVEVLAEDDTPVVKTKTNATGKWSASLPVGNYKINIIKTDTATKQKLQLSQNITVEPSDIVIVLPTAIMRA